MRIPKEETHIDRPRVKLFEIIIFIVLVVFLFISATIYKSIYKDHENTVFTKLIVNIFPIPAGEVNNDFIMYKDVFALDLLAKYQFPQDDHFSYALDAVVKQVLVGQLVNEVAPDFEFDDTVKIEQRDYEDYGWSADMYERYVLLPMQQSEALQEAVLSCADCQQSVRIDMEHIVSLIKMGIEFSDLAKQYSQVASSQFGGDVGYLTQDELGEELKFVRDYQIDQVSDVIELYDRFVIVKVYDALDVDGARDYVGIQMIVLYKNGLTEVLEQKKASAEIRIF